MGFKSFCDNLVEDASKKTIKRLGKTNLNNLPDINYKYKTVPDTRARH